MSAVLTVGVLFVLASCGKNGDDEWDGVGETVADSAAFDAVLTATNAEFTKADVNIKIEIKSREVADGDFGEGTFLVNGSSVKMTQTYTSGDETETETEYYGVENDVNYNYSQVDGKWVKRVIDYNFMDGAAEELFLGYAGKFADAEYKDGGYYFEDEDSYDSQWDEETGELLEESITITYKYVTILKINNGKIAEVASESYRNGTLNYTFSYTFTYGGVGTIELPTDAELVEEED
jgi:hypothetical protein